MAAALDGVRQVRNAAAHTPRRVAAAEVDSALQRLKELGERIAEFKG